mmetsp:Transcript_11368/g.12917  ORF Transcript_11368/g.12917 Transcript_11368/m.12917 type:complete len:158 (-) Transcript_11368:1172-1645(-)
MGRKYFVELRLSSEQKDAEEFVSAARKGNSNTVGSLVRKGIDVNSTASNGDTALFWAACQGNTDIVELLLDQDRIDVNMKTKNNLEWTALIGASVYGRTEVVRLLLDHPDTNVNITDRNRNTALFVAYQEGHKDILNLLLACRDLNPSLRNKYTPEE